MRVTFPNLACVLDFVTRPIRRSIREFANAIRDDKRRRARGAVVHHPGNRRGRLIGNVGFFSTRVSVAWRKKTVSSLCLQQIRVFTRMRFTRTSSVRWVFLTLFSFSTQKSTIFNEKIRTSAYDSIFFYRVSCREVQ